MQRGYWRFSLIGIGILVVLFASSLPDSFAHPAYVKSTPQAFQTVASSPPSVNVFFTEPIELKYSKISVIGPDGSRVDKNDPHNVDGDTASLGVSLQDGVLMEPTLYLQGYFLQLMVTLLITHSLLVSEWALNLAVIL